MKTITIKRPPSLKHKHGYDHDTFSIIVSDPVIPGSSILFEDEMLPPGYVYLCEKSNIGYLIEIKLDTEDPEMYVPREQLLVGKKLTITSISDSCIENKSVNIDGLFFNSLLEDISSIIRKFEIIEHNLNEHKNFESCKDLAKTGKEMVEQINKQLKTYD